MKVAARFPVKPNSALLGVLLVSHTGIFACSFWLLNQAWMIGLVLALSAVSFYFSLKQYLAITNSSDDLCWSGENWLMHTGENQSSVCYLELLPTSWITPPFCLLKFTLNEQQRAWFFTRKSLGERLYRELCYVAKLKLDEKSKSQ
jgi:hypothetical protein